MAKRSFSVTARFVLLVDCNVLADSLEEACAVADTLKMDHFGLRKLSLMDYKQQIVGVSDSGGYETDV